MMRHQQDDQEHLFYAFDLEDHVPKDHLLRGIDRLLDLSDLRQYLADFYSHTGRPSIYPELMIRMLIVRSGRVDTGHSGGCSTYLSVEMVFRMVMALHRETLLMADQ